MEAADVQCLHALIDGDAIQDAQPVALPAPSEKTRAVSFDLTFGALDLSIDLLSQATLLLLWRLVRLILSALNFRSGAPVSLLPHIPTIHAGAFLRI